MDAVQLFNSVETLQTAFEIIATATYLVAHLWKKPANVRNGTTYDYIVVGGGSAGCVVASRLSEDPNIHVLLIEAGDYPPYHAVKPGLVIYEKTSKLDWNYTTEFDNKTQLCHFNDVGNLALGKVVGGTSSINFLYYQRGIPRDYDSWAQQLGDPSWNYKNVLPLFKKSEKLQDNEIANSPYKKYHGFDGNIQVTKDKRDLNIADFFSAFGELGNEIVIDLNGKKTTGYSKQLLIIGEDGTRSSSAYGFISPAKNRSNLHVLTNAMVTKIIFDKKMNAVAVKVRIGNRDITVKARREIVLSAGPVNSAQLLMLSGIGPRQHLEEKGIKCIKDLPVGQNLQDHTAIFTITSLDIPMRPYCFQTPFNPGIYTAPIITGHVALNKSSANPDYTTHSYILDMDSGNFLTTFCTYEYRFDDKICQSYIKRSKNRQFLGTLVINPYPKSRGYVKLRSKNPTDRPIIQPAYFYNKDDIDATVEYVKHFLKVLKTEYFRKLNAKFSDPCTGCKGRKGREYWRCYVRCMMFGMSQLVGTCAMGQVVDSKLKVYGTRRLRVVGAEVIPNITLGDSYIPVMIAEKASLMMKDDYKRYN